MATSDTTETTTRTAVDTSAKPVPTPSLQLHFGKWNWREESDYAIAEGQVTNASDVALEDVTAVVTFKTKDDEFITSENTLIQYNPILPGQTSPWRVLARWNPAMSKAYVEFKTLYGGTLRAEQR